MKKSAAEPKQQVAGYNVYLLSRIEDVLEKFDQANIPFILVKGIALLCDVYGDPGERVMGDVDILVRPEDFEKAENCLTSAGFSFINSNMSNAAVYGITDTPEVYIDLHRSLVNAKSPSQKKIYSPDEDAIWKRAVSIDIGRRKALVLSPEDRINYLCFHLLKERFSKEKWLRDICLLIRKKEGEINEEAFILIAKRSGTYKLCAMVLGYLRRSRGLDTSFLAAGHPEKEFALYSAENAVFRFLIDRKIYPLREVLWLIMMDSASKKAAFIRDLARYVPKKISMGATRHE